ncbi:MAG: biotin--[acetyl-CoA-carboxylase] ligase [Myxococcota bacterium]
MNAHEPSEAARLSDFLITRHFARTVVVHRSIDSTNTRALALSKLGARHGLAVVATEQTAGRGQRGRAWRSAADAGLYVSFVLRTALEPAAAAAVTLATGVAVRSALQTISGADLGLKWPNDVLVREPGAKYGRKLAGILFEVISDQDAVGHAILGIGVNLKPPADPRLSTFATGLSELGPPPEGPMPVLVAIANALEPLIDTLENGDVGGVCAAWTAGALGIGEQVEVHHPDRVESGVFQGLHPDGALLLDGRPMYSGRIALPGIPRAPML